MPFFRFGGIPDWWGWRSRGEWSGHWPDFPDAGATGAGYTDGVCLLSLARLVVRAVGYVDGMHFDYVDIHPAGAI